MNPYETIKAHHAQHIYKRGKYKGDAPVEQRAKRHFRVMQVDGEAFAVRMYETDIATIYPDNSAVIDCGGYVGRTTTVSNLNEALRKFLGFGVSVRGNCRIMSASQPVLVLGRAKYRYYDGITLGFANGEYHLQSAPLPFLMRRIRKDRAEALHKGMAESGFRDAFRLLHNVAEFSPELPQHVFVLQRAATLHSYLEESLTDASRAAEWPHIIAHHAFYRDWDYSRGRSVMRKHTADKTWACIMQAAKHYMHQVTTSDVKVIEDKR